MENSSENLLKILIGAIVVLAIIIFTDLGLHFYFCNSLKSIQSKNQSIIVDTLKNIKINYEKNKFKIVLEDNVKDNIKVELNRNYDDFLIQYNQNQANWLNAWLTGLTILLAFIGLVAPLCFLKLYQDKKDEIDKLVSKMDIVIKETEKQKEAMQINVDDVDRKSEQMAKDIEDMKILYKQAKAEAEYTEFLNMYEKNKNIDTEKIEIGLKKILDIKPRHFGVCTLLVCIYMDKKDYTNALIYAKKAYEYSGNEKRYLYNLVEALLFNKEYTEALECLRQYNELKYAYIYEDDYSKWIEQINIIANVAIKNEFMNILNKIIKINR